MSFLIRKKTIKVIPILIGIIFNIGFVSGQLVSTTSELTSALSSAGAGSIITLKNGVWNNVTMTISKSGTATNKLTVKAQTVGGVSFEGNSFINVNGSHIVVDGITFKNPNSSVAIGDDRIIVKSGTTGNRLTNITFDNYNSTGTTSSGGSGIRYIVLSGTYHEVDHCAFLNKKNVGSCVLANRSSASDGYFKIHHNVFAYRRPENGTYDDQNDQDAIRIGTSSTSLSSAYTEVYDNLFYDWVGEIEIISNKSCNNKYYNNTFSNYAGTMTLRHGNDCEVYNNFFFANSSYKSGGVRVIGERHKVYNNYISGVRYLGSDNTGGINISNGRPNTVLNGYYQVIGAQIVNNTLVDCDMGIRVGTKVESDLTLAPKDVKIANNIMSCSSSSHNAIQVVTALTGTSLYEANSRQSGKWDITTGGTNTVVTGLLSTSPSNGFLRIISTSPAVNSAATGYTYITKDITNGTRDVSVDRGCEEYNGGGTVRPYTIDDLGVLIGPIASPYLTVSPQNLDFSSDGGNKTFTINSNLNFQIAESFSWVSLSSISGTGNATITVTVTANNSSEKRSGSITVSGTGVENQTITVNQVAQSGGGGCDGENVALGKAIVAFSSEQTGASNNPVLNLTNGTTTDRWSAEATGFPNYAVVDLGQSYTIGQVNVYPYQSRPYQYLLEGSLTSASEGFFTLADKRSNTSSTTVFNDSFSRVNARYVKITVTGIADASSTWTSISELQVICSAQSSSINELTMEESAVKVYPNPTTDQLTVSMEQEGQFSAIRIVDLFGKTKMEQNILSSDTELQINTSHLISGMYILQIHGINQSNQIRFIKK